MKKIHPLASRYSVIDKGTLEEKINNVGKYPKIIMIEPTTHCNFHCRMCPNGLGTLKRKRDFMSMETYMKIIDEITGKDIPIKYVGVGEPLLHPEILRFFKIAKDRGIICHMTTNGSMLTQDIMQYLIDIKFDSVKFSFQGIDTDTYREMRNSIDFTELMSTIERFYKLRGDNISPFITVTTSVTYETNEQIEHFKREAEKISDKVEIGTTMLDKVDFDSIPSEDSRKKLIECRENELKNRKRFKFCTEVYDALTISYDGKISPCCRDAEFIMSLGNIMDSSIEELWNCDKINYFRDILKDLKYDELPLCKDCYDYMGYTHSERK